MDIWPQLAYQYGIGGLFFTVTLLLSIRDGAVDWRAPSDKWTIVVLIAGLAGYFAFHAAWILMAS